MAERSPACRRIFGRRGLQKRGGTITEAEAEVIAAAGDGAATASGALDPTLSRADVAAARHEMADAAFRRDRMQAAMLKLGARLRESSTTGGRSADGSSMGTRR
jgi:hypothetical protein